MDSPTSPSDDPIIRTMQDPPARVPFEPEAVATSPLPNPLTNARPDRMITPPPIDPQAAQPASPPVPRNLGNPPSVDAPKPASKPQISYRPPDAPKEKPKPASPMTPPSMPSPPAAPPKTPAASAPPAAPEHHGSSGSATTIALSTLTLLLVAIGLPLVWLKTNAAATNAADTASKTRQDLAAISTKVDGFNATTKLIQDANAAAKQDLFNAGADELSCADTTSKVADVLLAEGNRLKAEGDAAKDQPKSQQGQWLIDRANELKQTSTACAASGTNAQTRSGIPVNK